jgi:choline dehydrogenase
VADTNAESGERIGMTPSSIKNGKRVSAASAFLHPIRHRPNLTILDRTRVGQLVFDGNRVVGVRGRRRGRQVEFRARREVLVSAGTIESAALLERSGIGRPDVLARAGVPLRVESPNVGERIIEQRGAAMQVKFKRPIGMTEHLNTLPKQGWEGFKYLLNRRGPIADAGYNIAAGIASSPEHASHTDVQGMFVPLALDATSFDSVKLAKHSGVFFLGYGIKPTTTSSIHITSADPDGLPEIDPHYLETEEDKKVGSILLDKAREIFAARPIADLIDEEEFPGAAVSTHEQVLAYAKDPGTTIYHAVGANAMGPNDDDVTDSRLRVRGVPGLRVVDASSFPVEVAGNTAAPTMVLGWRAADLITEENR